MGSVGCHGGKKPIRTGITLSSCRDCQGGVRIIATLWPKPCHDLVHRPGLRAICVAGCANIWRTDLRRHIRARNAEGVIPPPIHAHIGHGWHVAGYALCASTARRMPMMFRHIKTCRQVALRADRVAFGA